MQVRTRFAPSPTGYLHVGSARTALFSWLYAKKHHGKFILRIEDTDSERSTDESIQAIFDGMAWLGLAHDEGPFFQTKRMVRYQEVLQQLLDQGKAYKCYCTKERLEKLREEQTIRKEKPRYDRFCRGLSKTEEGQPFVIRFHNPADGEVTFQDQVYGEIRVNNNELDDLILARTDGMPTYNFCVVVDDLDMNITHVIRGDDHINNTPRQINIIHALGKEVPVYAHLPMILGSDGKRLSKRHGAVSVMQYRDEGYLSHALLNYLVRLGWSHGDQEIFSIKEMCDYFDLTKVSRGAASFNTEKLQWLNQHYLKSDPRGEVAQQLSRCFATLGVDTANGPKLTQVVEVFSERAKTLNELAQMSRFCFDAPLAYDENAAKKHITGVAQMVLETARNELSTLPAWEKEVIHDVIAKMGESLGVAMPKIAQPLRIALTGNTVSPSIDVTIELIGQQSVIERLDRAIAHFFK